MGKPIMGAPLWGDNAATIVASHERSSFPVERLLTMDPTERWEADVPASGPVSVTMDRGMTDVFSFVGLFHHNASADASFRVRAADTEAELDTNPLLQSDNFTYCVRLADSASHTGSATVPALSTNSFSFVYHHRPAHPRANGHIQRYTGGGSVTVATNTLGQLQFGNLSGSFITGTTRLKKGVHYVIAATYNDGTGVAELWINGVRDAVGVLSGLAFGTEVRVAPDEVERMSGEVNSIEVWNKALTGTEIATSMLAPRTGAESGLVSYWPFDEGTGMSVANDVAGGPALVFTGSPDIEWCFPDKMLATADQDSKPWRDAFFHWPIGINARWARVDIMEPLNSVLRVGRLFISPALQLRGFQQYPSDLIGLRDRSGVNRGQLGLSVTRGAIKKRKTFQLQLEDLDEVNDVEQILGVRGGSLDLAFVADPDASLGVQQSIMHGLGTLAARAQWRSTGQFPLNLTIEEL